MSAAETRRPDRLPNAMEPWQAGQSSALLPSVACLKARAVAPLSVTSHAGSLAHHPAPRHLEER